MTVAPFIFIFFVTVSFGTESFPVARVPPRHVTTASQFNSRHGDRQKRFAYEDNYDWEKDEKTLEYETQGEDQTLFQKIARNWQKVALRCIFGISILAMWLFCCQCCCKAVCPYVCDGCTATCDQWSEWCVFFFGCGKDPAYKKFNKVARSLGIDMDYETFQKIKKGYGVEGNLGDERALERAADNY